jgi:hypothetical protein
MSSPHGSERRKHVRVDGNWPVTAHAVEHTGEVRTFAATMLNVSLGGIRIEAAVTANLWADRPLTIDLPGDVGAATVTVRRFVEYGQGGATTSRWGVELTDLTIHQRVLWGRFVYTAARESGHALAAMVVRVAPSPESQALARGALAAAYSRRA